MITLSCAVNSQTIDTVCLDKSIAKKVLIAANEKKVLEESVLLLESEITNLEKQVANYEKQGAIQQNIIAARDKKIIILENQKVILLKDIAALDKKIKRMRTWHTIKTILITAASVAATVLIL